MKHNAQLLMELLGTTLPFGYLSFSAYSVRHSGTPGDLCFDGVPCNKCVHLGMGLKEIEQLILSEISALSVGTLPWSA